MSVVLHYGVYSTLTLKMYAADDQANRCSSTAATRANLPDFTCIVRSMVFNRLAAASMVCMKTTQ